MFCGNCGKNVADGAKFCSHCGAPVEVLDAAAPEKPVKEAIPVGEVREQSAEVTAKPAASEEASQSVPAFVPGVELDKFKMMNKMRGTSSMAATLGTGTLYVYDNGLRFGTSWGASVGSGVLGAIASTVINVSEAYDPNTYPLEQIQELRLGKYMGVYNTLVITMRNGDVWSFAPGMPGSKVPKLIISLLKPYMDKANAAN